MTDFRDESTHVRVVWKDGRSRVLTWDEYNAASFDPGPFYGWEIDILNPDEAIIPVPAVQCFDSQCNGDHPYCTATEAA